MAVKQNNTEANGGPSNVNGGTSGGNPNGTPSNVAGTKKKSINMDGGGVNMSVEQPGCSGDSQKLNDINNDDDPMVDNEIGERVSSVLLQNDKLSKILQWMHILDCHRNTIIPEHDVLKIYGTIIQELSKVEVPRGSPEQMVSFKEDIMKVAKFFASAREDNVLMHVLNMVCQLISDPESAPPSCAVAIIFDLFEVNTIMEAVRVLLDHKVPDQNIRCTIRVLSEWLRICNFCGNLNLWILAILTGLLDQGKLRLFDQVSADNIDIMFTSMIIPVLRPKVTPILFTMLKNIYNTPEVFHKVVAKFPRVFPFLTKQSGKGSDYAEDTKSITQKLVDITSALMLRFFDYGDLYEPVEHALKGFQPSEDYLKYINTYKSSGDSANSEIEENNKNARVGLVNLGNTCYMNSVLQALAMTKEFSREILLTNCKAPLIVNVQQQIALMLYSIRCVLTPSRVLNATRPPGFSPGLQQDSSEFLGHLLETLHENEVSYFNNKNSLSSCDDAGRSGKEASSLIPTECMEEDVDLYGPSIDDKRTEGSDESVTITSTIDKTFTGKLSTTYKCLTCGWKSHNVDSFRDFQLSFPEIESECGSNYSVQDLIDFYCSPEKLCGDNQYFCEKCQKLTDAERYINVLTAPKNLILTLKHFKYDQKYHLRAKLMHKVFHDEKVSLKVCAPNTLVEVGSVHYDLYAGVVHSGFSMDSGHYYTYASDVSNNWYKFNDNIVTVSASEELHNLTAPNTPYILFYQMSARSNETHEAQASTTFVKVEVPKPPALEELPSDLQTYVTLDNYAFTEEQKSRRVKITVTSAAQNAQRNDNDEDDEMPPSGGCGGNALSVNMNRFIC